MKPTVLKHGVGYDLVVVQQPKKLVLAILAIVGVLLYVVEAYVPMAPPMKTLIRVVVVLVVVLWLIRLFVGDIAIPSLR